MQQVGPPEEILADARAAAEAGLRLPLIAQVFHELSGDGLRSEPLPLDRPTSAGANPAMGRPNQRRRGERRRAVTLRSGITTGTCAAAAAKAAATLLAGGAAPDEVAVSLPAERPSGQA